jgi:glycosyltransferase involved in cell wall biosynthesis
MTHSINRTFDFAVLLPGIGVFGGIRRFIEIGNELVRRGHEFTIYHPKGYPPAWLPYAGHVRPLSDLPENRHQILICNDPPLLERFDNAAADLKVFYFVLENIRGERRIARNRDWTILANSTGMARHLWRWHRVRAETVVGGINLETFRPRSVERADEFRILTFGRLSRRKKGVPIVIEAAEFLARRLAKTQGGKRPLRLVLFDHIGPGNERDPRDGFDCAVPWEFHLNLSQDELAHLYCSCDVFASAEKRAGWANTVAEAMACGLPVVCTRSGARDLAFHRETAWVTPRHRWFVGRGLRTLHDDPVLARRLGNTALERVRSFSWSRVADQLLDVVSRRLGTRVSPL